MHAEPGRSGSPASTLLLPVFFPAIAVAFLLIVGATTNPEAAGAFFENLLAWITETFGWFYILSVALFLVFIVVIAFTRWGNIRLGPDHQGAQYSFPAWFAMLFSAGYGIVLLFFGVAEPVLHYADPPRGDAQTVEAAQQAMQIAFFHWGFHIWAIYGLVGLVLAYFSFRHGLPLSIRSALYPLIGDRIYGPIGHAVDVFAILGTLFGIATTLGLSVAQINAGLNYLWEDIPASTTVQVLIIAVITGLATISVVAGLDKGIKRLSIVNMALAGFLMAFVFIVGPSVLILETFLQNTGSYLNNVVERTFHLEAYERGDWIGNWTLFVFGWTIAWAPFVGMFIARISRGRTIRQFVFGVMFVPTLFTFVWFSIFGDTALNLIMNEGYERLIDLVKEDEAVALFQLYDMLPWSAVVSFVTVILIMTFFVTSSDSGSLVIDSLASGGATWTPTWQRVFWAVLEGVVAAVLLVAGGLAALQTMAIASALPFALIMLIAAGGLWRALVIEGYRDSSLQAYVQRRQQHTPLWKKRLAGMTHLPDRETVLRFIQGPVMESFEHVRGALREQGWLADAVFDAERGRAYLTVGPREQVDFVYDVRLTPRVRPSFVYPQMDRNPGGDEVYYRPEVFIRRGGQSYSVYDYSQQEIIDDVLDQFERYLHFLDTTPGTLPWANEAHDEMLNGPAGGSPTQRSE